MTIASAPENTTPKSTPRRGLSLVGLIEAMAAPHQIDRYLELVNPMATVRDIRAQVVAVDHPTADSVTLTLRPTRQWRGFQAGQFVQLGVVIDGVRHTRCYSPAGGASTRSGLIELTVKAHPGGLVSQYLYANAAPGLVVSLSQADGVFSLPADRPRRVLLISGGSGITPVMSMLRTLVEEEHSGEIVFVHYANTDADVAYARALKTIAAQNPNVKLVLVYTETGGGDLEGFFDRGHLDAVAPWIADPDAIDAQAYLCGPPGLMRGVREVFREVDVEHLLNTEEFAPAVAETGEAGGEVSFTKSGVAAENSGETLLEQAEAAGLNPEYGCRMGICFSCTSVKKAGRTRNVRTGETDDEPDKKIQLCVSAPVGDVTVDI
ncbi:Stearoyl-CoA 9-desaturase electron transfer partner [Rhodococcus erythropolis]|uniref:ferredoxin reductase n=1 Tax=Rhodococcus erythropolis TaxID=1833 RepID=UPI000BB3CCFB|nr:ferredoxin reductase [Rhodococcus erythropolis]PBI88835.1 Stearoyl-CoA 9-desaturase electron transfer partner [Rhodococcus erythropolis]